MPNRNINYNIKFNAEYVDNFDNQVDFRVFSFKSSHFTLQTELDPTFNMFLASKACLWLVPCLPVSSTTKTQEGQINREQAELNSQCLTVDTGNMTFKAIKFRNIKSKKKQNKTALT